MRGCFAWVRVSCADDDEDGDVEGDEDRNGDGDDE